jgi:hypothetical protein
MLAVECFSAILAATHLSCDRRVQLSPNCGDLQTFTTAHRLRVWLPRPLRVQCRTHAHAMGYSITASARAGNPASRIGNALASTQCWTNAATNFEAYMSDDNHRTTAGNEHAEQPFIRSVSTTHQDPKWNGVQDPMHGAPKRLAPIFAPHRAARRRIPILR